MNKHPCRVLAALVLLVLLAGCGGSASAQDQPRLILRYAENQPENYPTTRAARYFAELVEQRTQGNIRVRVYADGELGDESSVLEQVQFGGIDIARTSLGAMVVKCPDLSVLQLPYLYEDSDQMWRVLDGDIGASFLTVTRRDGIVGLSWFDAGARSFYTCEPIQTLGDFKGLRIRVQENETIGEIVKALGAIPEQIAYNDVYSAIMSGKVDGAENNWPSYASTGHYEGAPYVYLDEHTRVPEMQIMSTVAVDAVISVNPDYYTILCQCAKESALYERELWAETEEKAREEMLEKGVVVTVPTEADAAEMRQLMAVIYENLTEEELEIVDKIRKS